MNLKRKSWITLALSLKLLCFSLVTQPLDLNQRSSMPQSEASKTNLNKRQNIEVHPNNTPALSETEASSTCTEDCIHPQTPDQKAVSEIHNIIRVALPKESCELLPTEHQLKDGKLTDYWAQEMVGADLLKEELEKAPPLPENKFLVAVFDTTRVSHSIHVQNIISHEGPQAVLPALNSSQIQFFHTRFSSSYIQAIESFSHKTKNIGENTQTEELAIEILNSNKLPSFINNSMGWLDSQAIYETMSQISPPSVLVTVAGNDYPNPIEIGKINFSKNFDGILVGNLSPNGVVNGLSQEGEEVHILAPSDDYITSIDNNDNYEKFGGTSGAAPLVTGSLSGFEWLSDYHPTPEEAKLLLENTAVPTVHSAFENPRRNGVGMLNAYKLGMVAKRLKEKCKKNDHCFKMEILNSRNYEFSIDEEGILEQVQTAFPKCFGEDETQNISCEDKKSTFKKLRQAILLDTTNVQLWEQLHCIYNEEGFSENAENIRKTIIAITENKDFLESDIDSLFDTNSRAFSLVNRDQRVVFLNNLLHSNPLDVNERKKIVHFAIPIGGDEELEILHQIIQDLSEYDRKWIVTEIAPTERTAFQLSRLLSNNFSEDVTEILYRIRNMEENRRLKLYHFIQSGSL